MTTRRSLALAGFLTLAACGGDRGREVAVTDSRPGELETAPADTLAPPDSERASREERRAEAGGRASTSQARRPVTTRAPAHKRRERKPVPAVVADSAVVTDSSRTVAAAVPAPSPAETAPAAAEPAAPAPAETASASTPPPPPAAAPSSSAAGDSGASMHALPAGTQVRALLQDSISSLRNSAGQTVTALVSGDIRAPDGRTLVPSGSAVRLSITRIKAAGARSAADGELELRGDSVLVGGRAYPLRAEVQPVPHELKGRGVTAGEAGKVAAGAAAGAVAGGVITGKTKGAVIGGVVGAAGGAVVAAQTASRDVIVTPRTLVVLTLTAPFAAVGGR